jgi:hypothetical protein
MTVGCNTFLSIISVCFVHKENEFHATGKSVKPGLVQAMHHSFQAELKESLLAIQTFRFGVWYK